MDLLSTALLLALPLTLSLSPPFLSHPLPHVHTPPIHTSKQMNLDLDFDMMNPTINKLNCVFLKGGVW